MTDHDTLHPLRPFLKNYVWEHGRIGTRYLDCANGQVGFDEGKKSRFAAEKYLYVPLGKDAPDDVRAEGPAIHEAALARFLRAAQLGKPEEAGSAAEVQRAVQLVALHAHEREQGPRPGLGAKAIQGVPVGRHVFVDALHADRVRSDLSRRQAGAVGAPVVAMAAEVEGEFLSECSCLSPPPMMPG